MKPQKVELRYERVKTCKECGNQCGDYTRCKSVKKPLDNSYNGIRFTADGYDCALPVSIDSHTSCSYSCLYCFSEFLGGHVGNQDIKVKQYNLKKLEGILSGSAVNRQADAIRLALKRGSKQPCPVQLGALCDPFDNIERNQGWALQLPKLLKKYNQPCRISTKGTLLQLPEYLDAFSLPEIFWVAFSIITVDDDLLKKIDRFAPTATERLKTMKALSDRGVSTSLRFRPLIPNVSDKTRKHPKAYKELIERSAEAGAKAISMEVLFTPGMLLEESKKRWSKLESIIGVNLREHYKKITILGGSCNRPDRRYVEDIFYAAREVAHSCGMTFAVSDPVMKHLNDTGCCCGILPDDPIFGGWQRENATNAVVEARDLGKEIVGTDYIPPWSHSIMKRDMCCIVGPAGKAADGFSWGQELRNTWNDLKSNRGTLFYFQNILKPTKLNKDKDIVYRYNKKTEERKHTTVPLFKA